MFKRSKSIVLCLVILLASVAATAQAKPASKAVPKKSQGGRLQEREFQSESLGRPMRYRILLPTGYGNSERSYPVLYLLHGWHGDYQNWTTLTNVTHDSEGLPIIIVMPDANDSWYVDSATVAQDKFEQYMMQDLTKEIDQHWRTLRSSHRRAIAGLSMGGYGAVTLALKHPGTFAFAGSISGAFNASQVELAAARTDLAPSLDKAYGPADSATRAGNDVFQLAEHAAIEGAPYLYIDCGWSDVSFLPVNRNFVAKLSDRKLAYEYHEFPGAHSWQYWDERLPDLLKAVVLKVAHD